MAHSSTKILIHAIFSTKDPGPLITTELIKPLHAYLGGIAKELGCKALGIGGTADHVHALLWIPASLSVAEVMRVMKTNSSRWANQREARIKFGWQTGYGAFSVSESKAAATLSYIRNQEKHHRKVTFQQEFLRFLRKYSVPFDERYLWK